MSSELDLDETYFHSILRALWLNYFQQVYKKYKITKTIEMKIISREKLYAYIEVKINAIKILLDFSSSDKDMFTNTYKWRFCTLDKLLLFYGGFVFIRFTKKQKAYFLDFCKKHLNTTNDFTCVYGKNQF